MQLGRFYLSLRLLAIVITLVILAAAAGLYLALGSGGAANNDQSGDLSAGDVIAQRLLGPNAVQHAGLVGQVLAYSCASKGNRSCAWRPRPLVAVNVSGGRPALTSGTLSDKQGWYVIVTDRPGRYRVSAAGARVVVAVPEHGFASANLKTHIKARSHAGAKTR